MLTGLALGEENHARDDAILTSLLELCFHCELESPPWKSDKLEYGDL